MVLWAQSTTKDYIRADKSEVLAVLDILRESTENPLIWRSLITSDQATKVLDSIWRVSTKALSHAFTLAPPSAYSPHPARFPLLCFAPALRESGDDDANASAAIVRGERLQATHTLGSGPKCFTAIWKRRNLSDRPPDVGKSVSDRREREREFLDFHVLSTA